ncbi:hypothetical protein C6H68_06415 [Photorhabdus luminescens]|nr:hypothetical protein C6H68_06415 [Photorhabdus luminescens]
MVYSSDNKKNPIVLNQNGLTIGFLNMGISKKSSGINSDCGLAKKFFVIRKKKQIFFQFDENNIFCTNQPSPL